MKRAEHLRARTAELGQIRVVEGRATQADLPLTPLTVGPFFGKRKNIEMGQRPKQRNN